MGSGRTVIVGLAELGLLFFFPRRIPLLLLVRYAPLLLFAPLCSSACCSYDPYGNALLAGTLDGGKLIDQI